MQRISHSKYKSYAKQYKQYFSEVIGSDDVVFDYTLHNGISNSSNAINLLSVIGFPPDIIKNAKEEAAKLYISKNSSGIMPRYCCCYIS